MGYFLTCFDSEDGFLDVFRDGDFLGEGFGVGDDNKQITRFAGMTGEFPSFSSIFPMAEVRWTPREDL